MLGGFRHSLNGLSDHGGSRATDVVSPPLSIDSSLSYVRPEGELLEGSLHQKDRRCPGT